MIKNISSTIERLRKSTDDFIIKYKFIKNEIMSVVQDASLLCIVAPVFIGVDIYKRIVDRVKA